MGVIYATVLSYTYTQIALPQIILEFLSGFTIGMFFLSGSVMLIISLIGYDFINSG